MAAAKKAALPPIPPIERFWEKFLKPKTVAKEPERESEQTELPATGVLFLGGPWNMVKKIRQLHPEWMYITDDGFKPFSAINVDYVFYWTNHSSHMMMENVFSKLAPGAKIMYVTATNMDRLEREMVEQYCVHCR